MTKKLVKYTDGKQLTGELVKENTDSWVLDIEYGRLTIPKSSVLSCESIFNCSLAEIGQYISTPQGVYVKIAEDQFRLVAGPYTSPVDISSIQEGQYITHEEAFATEAEPEIFE